MYKEHISSDSDYDSVQAFAQHKVPGLFVIFAMPSPCLYFLPNLGPDQRCRGRVRAAAVILIRGELTILSPLVSFGSVCWLIGHSAPPTAPPRPADHKNQTVENFLISRTLKYENWPHQYQYSYWQLYTEATIFPCQSYSTFPTTTIGHSSLNWRGSDGRVGSLNLCFPHKYS